MITISYKSIKDKLERKDGGFRFKDDNAFETGEGVCYIPESNLPENEEDDEISGFTRADIILLCEGNVKLASNLFHNLDWQQPDTLFNEWEEHGDLEPYCDKDGYIVATDDLGGGYVVVIDCTYTEGIIIKLTDEERKECEKYNTFEEYVWEVLSDRYEFDFDNSHWMITDNPKIRKENYGTEKEN